MFLAILIFISLSQVPDMLWDASKMKSILVRVLFFWGIVSWEYALFVKNNPDKNRGRIKRWYILNLFLSIYMKIVLIQGTPGSYVSDKINVYYAEF